MSRDGTGDARVRGVRFEHHREPLGIGERRPRISWKTATDAPGWRQSAYEVEVREPAAEAGWTSGRVESDESVLVPWDAPELRSRDRCAVRVRVWGADGAGRPSPWSDDAVVEAGLLEPEDWTAELVAPAGEEERPVDGPAPLLRREFALRPGVASARLYVTAHGVYEVEINGVRVGDHALAPGWTSYGHRLRYQTFDVTGLLRPGENAVGAQLADGWFRGRVGFEGGVSKHYGDRVALLAQLEVAYDDGTTERVGTDGAWRSAEGPITAASLYDGESYDARRERDGWSSPGYAATGWSPVTVEPLDAARLVAPTGPPVRRTQELEPAAITTSPSGRTIVDFGQNLVGRPRLRVSGKTGETITLRHAEVLQDGELCVRPLRQARATDTYVLRGTGDVEEWEPRFTFHGFRYAEVTGWPGEIERGQLTAAVYHTDMERTGWFACSDPLLDRFHENVVWGMRGNFLDVPTDCPQRDERLGWTGDLQIFAPTASFLYDCAGLVTSWLRDLAAEQGDDGNVPVFIPFVPAPFGGDEALAAEIREAAMAAWGDAAVIVPWVMRERFADVAVLRRQFDSMRAWVDLEAERAGEDLLWDSGRQLGDWLDPTAPPDRPMLAATDKHLVATAYLAHSARLISRIATLLGRTEDAGHYAALADGARDAFNREYVSPAGRVASDSQTGYALALAFDLLETDAQRERAGKRLAELVAIAGHRISTGFVGTPLLCDVLEEAGELGAAYALLLQTECPSWLYSVTMGATTVWERWDSLLPDGTVNPGDMTSFNHYALGAVADWMHRTVAGLAPAAPGYRRLLIRPRPGGGLRHAEAAHETPYGRVEVRWRREDGALEVEVLVPPNTTARVELPAPDHEPVEVGSGAHRFSVAFRDPDEDERPGAPGWLRS
jgi:alpha-L-rhamnosidase